MPYSSCYGQCMKHCIPAYCQTDRDPDFQVKFAGHIISTNLWLDRTK